MAHGWIKGFNFRATQAFVADGPNETYVLHTDTYPTTRNGVTFGWNLAVDSRNRDSGIDRRLAGINFDNTVGRNFRVDLPATGEYEIRIAAGDHDSNNYANWDLQDDATVFRSLSFSSVNIDNFKDATDVVRTRAAWPAENESETRTFVSQIFRLRLRQAAGGGAGGTNNVIAHLEISEVATHLEGTCSLAFTATGVLSTLVKGPAFFKQGEVYLPGFKQGQKWPNR